MHLLSLQLTEQLEKDLLVQLINLWPEYLLQKKLMSKDLFSGRISGLRRGKWDVTSCLEDTYEEKGGENVNLNINTATWKDLTGNRTQQKNQRSALNRCK